MCSARSLCMASGSSASAMRCHAGPYSVQWGTGRSIINACGHEPDALSLTNGTGSAWRKTTHPAASLLVLVVDRRMLCPECILRPPVVTRRPTLFNIIMNELRLQRAVVIPVVPIHGSLMHFLTCSQPRSFGRDRPLGRAGSPGCGFPSWPWDT